MGYTNHLRFSLCTSSLSPHFLMSSEHQPSRNSFLFIRFSYFLASACKKRFLLGNRTEDTTSLKMHCRNTTALFSYEGTTHIPHLPKDLMQGTTYIEPVQSDLPRLNDHKRSQSLNDHKKNESYFINMGSKFSEMHNCEFRSQFIKSKCFLSFMLLGS